MFVSVFLLVWVSSRCPGVCVRCLVRPALAGSPRDGLVHRPSIESAVSRVAEPLWEDGRRTGQEEVDGWREETQGAVFWLLN